METATKLAWVLLALIHASPAAVLFAPRLTLQLYGVDPGGTVGLLITHRGALFLAIVIACAFAVADPGARRCASVVVALSMLSFLVLYARAGMPAGALRTIALADLAGLLPLLAVSIAAWRAPA
jgi:hypothetical protein